MHIFFKIIPKFITPIPTKVGVTVKLSSVTPVSTDTKTLFKVYLTFYKLK